MKSLQKNREVTIIVQKKMQMSSNRKARSLEEYA